jgi:LysR family transcriptional activator of nhaA
MIQQKGNLMIKWLNYHHLLYFRVIATEGSIVQASRTLLVGQSALSTQLKQLEESLGQKLFERKNKSLILTEAGKVALDYADEIFRKGEEFVQVFNDENLSAKSHYKIGVVASAPKIIACKLMEKAQEFGDNCFISMSEETSEELVRKINAHELDLALTNNLSVLGKENLQIKPVGSGNIGIYGSKKFQKLTKGFPQSLNGAPFILPTKHSKLRYDLEHVFLSLKIHYDLVAEVQDSSVKKMMGEHGRGLISLPEFAAKPLVKEGKLFKLGKLANLKEEYWLITKKRTISSPITDIMLDKFMV